MQAWDLGSAKQMYLHENMDEEINNMKYVGVLGQM